ncbi:acyltransferase family protein [Paenibacillus sp. GCM10027627]|uniref:acyltransferase family protein n=1 Tax=unclassified Paenibacillus TaxID=185978 RepID=UPI00362F08FD
MSSKVRIDELDSVRGLAALSVVFSHIAILIPSFFLERFNNTPLHFFWLGHESVILFFILSGFVLSLPFQNNRISPLGYVNYLVRRVFRILIPAAVSMAIVLILISTLNPQGLNGISEWGNSIWTNSLNTVEIVKQLILLQEIDSMQFNPVLWSLVHEMRISIIFPLVLLLMFKFNLIRRIAVVILIPITFFVAYVVGLKVFNYDITKFSGGYSSYILTPHYLAFFTLGSILAKYRESIKEIYMRLNLIVKFTLVVVGLVLYMYNWLILPDNSLLHMFIFNDWSIAIGGSIFIVVSMNSVVMKRVLLFNPVHYIGKISYSIYLYHLIMMLTMLYVLNGMFSVPVILLMSVPVTLIVSAIMYHLIEVPSMRLGKILSFSKPKQRSNPIPHGANVDVMSLSRLKK